MRNKCLREVQWKKCHQNQVGSIMRAYSEPMAAEEGKKRKSEIYLEDGNKGFFWSY